MIRCVSHKRGCRMEYKIICFCLLHIFFLQGSDSQRDLHNVEQLESQSRIALRRSEQSCLADIKKSFVLHMREVLLQRDEKIMQMYAGDLHRSWPDEPKIDDVTYNLLYKELDQLVIGSPTVQRHRYIELQCCDPSLKRRSYLNQSGDVKWYLEMGCIEE